MLTIIKALPALRIQSATYGRMETPCEFDSLQTCKGGNSEWLEQLQNLCFERTRVQSYNAGTELHLLSLVHAVLETASNEMRIPLSPFDMGYSAREGLGMLSILFDFPNPERVPLDPRSEESVVSY